jgi:hypothetical protein
MSYRSKVKKIASKQDQQRTVDLLYRIHLDHTCGRRVAEGGKRRGPSFSFSRSELL